jgi:signal transduction histidine kinase
MPGLRKLADWSKFQLADVFDAPAEWVIAQGRLYLCAFSLIAVSLDPPQPFEIATATSRMLWIYFLFSIGLVIATNWRLPDRQSRIGIHCADIIVTSLLLLLTQAMTGPFFVFFTFVLLAATLRWDWPSVFATLIVLLLVLIVLNTLAGAREIATPGAIPNNFTHLLVRASYLVVIGGMLAYVGAQRERSRRRLARLATWPSYETGKENMPALHSTIAHAVDVMRAPRAIVIWKEDDAPFLKIAVWRSDGFEELSEPACSIESLIAPQLAGHVFAVAKMPSKVAFLRTGDQRITGPIIDPALQRRFMMSSVASAPIQGTICSGRVFILDRSVWNEDLLLLTVIIASRLAVELDRQVLHAKAQRMAALRERVDLAHDLHDGVLQSLTAARLQLKLADRSHDQETAGRLQTVMQLLFDEQRRIRRFVESARTQREVTGSAVMDIELRAAMEACARNWNMELGFVVEPSEAQITRQLAFELSLVLAEGVANAARHGRATRMDVTIKAANDHLLVAMNDTGCGFAKDVVTSTAGKHEKPNALRRRVEQLRGKLAVLNTASGAQLEIWVPLP